MPLVRVFCLFHKKGPVQLLWKWSKSKFEIIIRGHMIIKLFVYRFWSIFNSSHSTKMDISIISMKSGLFSVLDICRIWYTVYRNSCRTRGWKYTGVCVRSSLVAISCHFRQRETFDEIATFLIATHISIWKLIWLSSSTMCRYQKCYTFNKKVWT